MEHTDQVFHVENDIFPHEEPRGLRLRSAQVWASFTSFFHQFFRMPRQPMNIFMRRNEDVVLLRVSGPTVIGRKELGELLSQQKMFLCKLLANVHGNIWTSGVRHRGEASLGLLTEIES